METSSNNQQVILDTRANDFYMFFRSGTHHEVHDNLLKLSRHSNLDKHDLALLVMMLGQLMTDLCKRRQLLSDTNCRGALQTILETVQNTEAKNDTKPYENDVEEVMVILQASPVMSDMYWDYLNFQGQPAIVFRFTLVLLSQILPETFHQHKSIFL